MPTPLRLQLRTDDPANVLAPYFADYRQHFEAGRYRSKTRRYIASVVHFGEWLQATGQAVSAVDEKAVARFLSEHLPSCTCRRPVPQGLITNRAALNHLVRLLRRQHHCQSRSRRR